jgi:hypothetical protein
MIAALTATAYAAGRNCPCPDATSAQCTKVDHQNIKINIYPILDILFRVFLCFHRCGFVRFMVGENLCCLISRISIGRLFFDVLIQRY